MESEEYEFIEKTVRVGARGQITIPKKMRKFKNLKEKEEIRVFLLPGGEMVVKKVEGKAPEDRILEIVSNAPKINFKDAWSEIQKEREVER